MNTESSSSESIPDTRSSPAATETLPSTDLRVLENRLRTFDNRWPLSWLRPELLANAGFFYFNFGDQVKCAFCGGIIGEWELNDVPLVEHQKFFPDCPVIRAQETQQPQAGTFEEDNGIQSVQTPKSPEFSTLDSRLRSYGSWNASIQDPTVLSQAGFYYLGTGDEVSLKLRGSNNINKISIFRSVAFTVMVV